MVGSSIYRELIKNGYGKEEFDGFLLTPKRNKLNLLNENEVELWFKINKPTIVLRKAVRFSSSKKEVTASSTPLLERMFTRLEGRIPAELGRFQVVCNPTFRLKNIAGTGVVTESMESVDSGASATKIAETAACHLIRDNLGHEPFISPGFCFTLDGVEYQVTSRTYGTVAGKKKVSKSKKK